MSKEIYTRKEVIEMIKENFDNPELSDGDIAEYANEILIFPDNFKVVSDSLFSCIENYL